MKSVKYLGRTIKIKPELFIPNNNKKFIIDRIKAMSIHLSPFRVTEESNYYMYHKIRLERAERYKKFAELKAKGLPRDEILKIVHPEKYSTGTFEENMTKEAALHQISQPETIDVEPLGQETYSYTYDWMSE